MISAKIITTGFIRWTEINLKRMNISTRLILVFSIVILAIVIISISTVIQLKNSAVISRNIIEHPYIVSNTIRDIEVNIVAMHRSMKDVVLAKYQEEIATAIAIVNEYEQRALVNFNIVFERFLGNKTDVEDAYNTFLDWRIIRDEVIDLVQNGDRDSAIAITQGKGSRQVELIFEKINGLLIFADQKAKAYRDEAYSQHRLHIRNFIIFVSIMILLSAGFAFFLIHSISVPIGEIINRIKDIGRKQYDIDIDIIGDNQLELLKQSVDQLDTIAEQLNREIDERKTTQAELEEYKNSLEELVQKRTRELDEAQKLLSKSIDDADIGMVLVEPGGRFKMANRKFCDIVGYSDKELQKMTFQDITYSEDYSIGADAVKNMIEEKIDKTEIIKRYQRKNGEIIHVRLFTALIRDEINNPIYFFTQAHDITEQVVNSEKLADYSKNLEKLVQQRTRELESKAKFLEESQQALSFLLEDVNEIRVELELANRRYEQSNRELEAFSYSVSHDLRAPLRSIDGFSQVIMEDFKDRLGEDGLHYFQRVRVASQNMSILIDDMLTLSRITRQNLNTVELDFSDLCREVVSELIVEYDEKIIDIKIQPGLTMNADKSLLKVLMANLIGNALKFTSKKRQAKIEIGSKTDNDQTVYFVSDNGAGFDMKYVGKLFSPFQRLHSATEFPGTGIGLATVQRIINKHGGSVWAKSENGKGTTISFTI